MVESLEQEFSRSEGQDSGSSMGAQSGGTTDRRVTQPTEPLNTSLVRPSEPEQNRISRRTYVTQRTKLMMGAYARVDFEDPDIYLNTCVAVLSPFPDRVIETVTDIAKGIQTESAYPPRVAELRARAERCERSLIAMETVKAKKIGADKFRNEMPRPVDRSNHPTIEELKEKHNYWLGGDRDNQPAPFDQKPAGRRANLLVPRSSPRYEQMVERSKKADPADWRRTSLPVDVWHSFMKG